MSKILCLYKRKIEFFPHTVTSHNVDLLFHASLRSVPRGGICMGKCTDFFTFHGQWGGISSRKLEERRRVKSQVFNLGPLFLYYWFFSWSWPLPIQGTLFPKGTLSLKGTLSTQPCFYLGFSKNEVLSLPFQSKCSNCIDFH